MRLQTQTNDWVQPTQKAVGHESRAPPRGLCMPQSAPAGYSRTVAYPRSTEKGARKGRANKKVLSTHIGRETLSVTPFFRVFFVWRDRADRDHSAPAPRGGLPCSTLHLQSGVSWSRASTKTLLGRTTSPRGLSRRRTRSVMLPRAMSAQRSVLPPPCMGCLRAARRRATVREPRRRPAPPCGSNRPQRSVPSWSKSTSSA